MMVTRQKQPNQSPTGLFAIKEPTKTWEVFMYSLLIKLMILSALPQLGISTHKFATCNSRGCASRIEKASRDVLKIDWKPISIFPEEGRRFR